MKPMNEDKVELLHVLVSGHVQGVGFRMFVYGLANRLDLYGWVRNRLNGDVEIIAEGPRSKLEQLLVHVRQGPPSAQVIDVTYEWQDHSGIYNRFDFKANL